jgi:hypothetical protein
MPVILATWKAEIRRIRFKASLGKKFVRPSSQQKKLSMVVHTCYLSYCKKHKIGGLQSGPAWAKVRFYLKNNHSKKGCKYDSSSRVPA